MLTGSEHTEIDTETLDAVGEIVNIIAGNAKKNLEESFALVISLPTIIKGVDHVVAWPSGEEARIICIPFKLLPSSMTEDTFYLSVAIEAAGGK
jgi:chemotaxis protein CheX